MELVLDIIVYPSGSFEVYRNLQPRDQYWRDSVLTIDYAHTEWPRHDGNLLW